MSPVITALVANGNVHTRHILFSVARRDFGGIRPESNSFQRLLFGLCLKNREVAVEAQRRNYALIFRRPVRCSVI